MGYVVWIDMLTRSYCGTSSECQKVSRCLLPYLAPSSPGSFLLDTGSSPLEASSGGRGNDQDPSFPSIVAFILDAR